ncbi:DUF3754 domain-containing protein [Halioglobus maricola]|uniref:DUF3754 domain-containing protein n=2 Tax=Halioglobus maricola TaxID=2601894 RepID=A0A5P9NQ72_9GAMM|nr:DUF3754 domain-containing protein [Halioglobus maricola]
MCLADATLSTIEAADFEAACEQIETHFQREFHNIKQRLKEAYGPLDPDTDTRTLAQFHENTKGDQLAEILDQVLDRANYEKVTRNQLEQAFASASLFDLKLYVDLDDFDEALLFTRGVTTKTEEVKRFLGLWTKAVTFINFDRVVLYIRFKDNIDTASTLGGCQPGSTMLKLYQNVPGADVEMLFPNTRIGMRMIDKLLIGVPALVSGGIVMTTKLGTTLILLGSLFGFWLGMRSEPVVLDKAAMLVLLAGAGTLVGYLWKQYSSFRNRKLRYTQTLTENLYFKLLDNNAGVIFRILDEAEESECKESLLAYYFLLRHPNGLTAQELDRIVEQWLSDHWQCTVDFEIEDALGKLAALGLASLAGDQWSPTKVETS